MIQKGFSSIVLLLGVIFVIGLISGGYYLRTQNNKHFGQKVTVDTVETNEPTASPETPVSYKWVDFVSKTKDLNLGATFKYPEGWFVFEDGEGNQRGNSYRVIMQNYPLDICESKTDCKKIEFNLALPADGSSQNYKEISSLSIEEKLVKEVPEVGSEIYTRKKDLLVDGINAFQYTIQRAGKYTPRMSYQALFLMKRQQNYYYNLSSSDEDLLQEFVKTINFIEVTKK